MRGGGQLCNLIQGWGGGALGPQKGGDSKEEERGKKKDRGHAQKRRRGMGEEWEGRKDTC
jgi:hypothetical protein